MTATCPDCLRPHASPECPPKPDPVSSSRCWKCRCIASATGGDGKPYCDYCIRYAPPNAQ